MAKLDHPINETVRLYEPASDDRKSLEGELNRLASNRAEIPCFIGGKAVFTGIQKQVRMPHSHSHILADYHVAGSAELVAAAEAARRAKPQWETMSWQDRASIFLKAADLLSGPYRPVLNAATMLGQSKNFYQAEIDSACELIDFLRFNVYFYQEIMAGQPLSVPGVWNQTEYRPLEGFVLAITPFNFTAIAGNLPAAPALCGNTVVWKPSATQMLSAYYTMQVFREAGLPDGVINLVGADGAQVSQVLLPRADLAGVHFTGSTQTFQRIWKTIGENISGYRGYPRLVGETGGKGFVFVHPSGDPAAVSAALIRGAFEYQGQKCSAASRAYLPKNLWKEVKSQLVSDLATLRVGDVRRFENFMNAVIDEAAFKRISETIDRAKKSGGQGTQILAGGKYSSEKGYFIDPTVIQTDNPHYECMVAEIFGPVLSIYVYDESKVDETLEICDSSTPYSLTGAVFAQDRHAVRHMTERLKNSAGNFYINDKPTGAVVGQQPFGGSRLSGTNDKAGSPVNLYRWLSPRTIKETFLPPKDYRYSFMGRE